MHTCQLVQSLSVALALLIAGCSGSAPSQPTDDQERPQPARPATSTTPLVLIVVDDPEVATVAQREWTARSGQQLTVRSLTAEELLRSNDFTGDVIYFPGWMLGELAERSLIRAVPTFALRPGFAGGDLSEHDLFSLLRRRGMKWGKETMALPSTERTLVLGYRTDVLDRLELAVPQTWAALSTALQAYTQLKSDFQDQDLPKFAFAQPNLGESCALGFIARGATYAKVSGRYSMLFDLSTMKPQIDQQAFIRALNELIADQQHTDTTLQLTPAAAVEQLLLGHVAFAIGWLPTNAPEVTGVPVRFAPLPGADVQFDMDWSPREETERASVLGSASRYVGVLDGTRKQRSAWNLAVRLAGKEWGHLVSMASSTNSPVRHSSLLRYHRWLDSETHASWEEAIRQSMHSEEYAFVPRLPGAQNYRNTMSTALERVNTDTDATALLRELAEQWQAISSERPGQVQAYYRSLGLEP